MFVLYAFLPESKKAFCVVWCVHLLLESISGKGDGAQAEGEAYGLMCQRRGYKHIADLGIFFSLLAVMFCMILMLSRFTVTSSPVHDVLPEIQTTERCVQTYNSRGQQEMLIITREPQRIVVMDWNNIEILLALGLADRIVLACMEPPHTTDLQERYPEEFAKIQKIAPERVGLEVILAAQPDLIFARQSAFSERRLQTTEWWHKRGVNTYIPVTSNTREKQTIEKELRYIRDVGIVFGCSERAEAIAADISAQIGQIREQTAGRRQDRVIVLEGAPSKYVINYNARWLVGDFLHALGASMVTDVQFRDAETLLVLDPDVIFVEYFDDTTASFADQLMRHPEYHSLKAVQEKRVYPIPVEFMYMPGLHTAKGLCLFAKGLYPDIEETLINSAPPS